MYKYPPFNLFIRQALLYPLTSPFLPPIAKVEKDYSYAAGKLIGTLEAAPPQGIPKTGQTEIYEDYDDGYYQKGYPLTGDRFTDNEDGTITDNATGLMWAKDGNGVGGNNGNALTWAPAVAYPYGLTFAGHSDWRLPNIKELISILDFGRGGPTIDPLFINTKTDIYWTSTTNHAFTTQAFYVHFSDSTIGKGWKTDNRYLRLVRDA